MSLVLALAVALAGAASKESPEEKEAYIWYLGHSGWAIQTKSRFLIFDYWESTEPESERALANGHIRPEEIRDQNVIVFVSQTLTRSSSSPAGIEYSVPLSEQTDPPSASRVETPSKIHRTSTSVVGSWFSNSSTRSPTARSDSRWGSVELRAKA